MFERHARRIRKKTTEKGYNIGNLKDISNIHELGTRLLEDENVLSFKWDGSDRKLTTTLIPAAKAKDDKDAWTVLWYDVQFINIFKKAKLYIDGTYKSRPKLKLGRAAQFLTIMAQHNGKVSAHNINYGGCA